MVRRRSILVAVGASASTGVGVVSGRGGRPSSAREAGVTEAVADHLAAGEIDAATELLEDHRIAHAVGGGPTGHGPGAPSEGPSIESRYSESESSVYCTLFHLEDDRWLASGVVSLSDRRYRLRDAAMVPDACGIAYDPAEWTSPDPTAGNVFLSSDDHDIAYESYAPLYGPAATVELGFNEYPDTAIGLQTELIRRGSHPDVPVTFAYEHTYALLNDYLELVSVSVGATGLSVSLPTGASRAWIHEATASPGPGDGAAGGQ